ncbi:MAG: hypothetical protein GC149_03270 [Gammaproteobacteria bacterium]|nr:hypothetical protein [Gammaproteobacteria bacterium]
MLIKITLCLSLLFLELGDACAETRTETGIDPEANLPFWQISDAGMSLRLVQRLPDQTRGYFMARGFSESDAELVAMSCVFQTIFKNVSNLHQPSPLEYNLRDWQVSANGVQQQMKMREDWKREWQTRKAPLAAQLAFEWSLYPTHQVYKPGDYNWGMSIFNLRPGTRFDLTVVWHQFGESRTAIIKNMECAADIHPSSGGSRQP